MGDVTKKKFKLPSWATYVLFGLEVVVMIVLVVIAFMTMNVSTTENPQGFLKWLALNQVWFFVLIVLPLIVLFLANIYFLIKILNEPSAKKFSALSNEELMEEARRQAREEFEKEQARQKEENPEE